MVRRSNKAKGKSNASKDQSKNPPIQPERRGLDKPIVHPLNITQDSAKSLSKLGHMEQYTIVRPCAEAPWCVALVLNGGRHDWLLTTRGEVREFSSLDTAYKACRAIGNDRIEINDSPLE